MLKVGDRVQIKNTKAFGVVRTLKRTTSFLLFPIGVILEEERGYDFLDNEDWLPPDKLGHGWTGNEEELWLIPEKDLEILYKSLFEEPEKNSGYYQKENFLKGDVKT